MNYRLMIPVCASLVGLILGGVWGSFQTEESTRDPAGARTSLLPSKQPATSMGDSRVEAFNNALNIVGGTMDLRQLAQLQQELTLIDPERVPLLLDRLENDTSDDRSDRLTWLFRWWYPRDPSRATAWIQKRLRSLAKDGSLGDGAFSIGRQQLFEPWAKANPKDALQFARDYPRSGIAAYLLGCAVEAWPDQSGPARMALVMEFPAGKAREGVLRAMLAKWGEEEPAAAFAAVQELANINDRKKAIATVLEAWGKNDSEAAFAKYRDIGSSDVSLASSLLRSLAGKNPARAVELLAQINPEQIAQVAPEIVVHWAERDPAAAYKWAIESGLGFIPRSERTPEVKYTSYGRTMIISSRYIDPLDTALKKHPEAVLDSLDQLPPGSDRDRLTERATTSLRDLDQSKALLGHLPPEAAARAVRHVALLYASNPERVEDARRWAESLPEGPMRTNAWEFFGRNSVNIPLPPAGPDRDAMLSGKVLEDRSNSDPVPSLETAMQIGDPVLRRDMLDELLEHYVKSSLEAPQKAVDWLEKTDVPEEWKKRWRAQVQAQ